MSSAKRKKHIKAAKWKNVIQQLPSKKNTVAAVTSPPRSERHSPRYLFSRIIVEQLNLSVEICTHYLGYPTAAAKCRGVCWKLSSSLTSAPWSTNKVTIALWPRLKYNMYWCRIYIKFFFFNVYFTQNWIRYSFFINKYSKSI